MKPSPSASFRRDGWLIGIVAVVSVVAGSGSFFAVRHLGVGIAGEGKGGSIPSSPEIVGRPDRRVPPPTSKRNLFDPAHPLTSAEYKQLYEAALKKEAQSNPELAKVLALHDAYQKDNRALGPITEGINAWVENGQDAAEKTARRSVFNGMHSITHMLATTYQWKEADLAAITDPEDTSARKRFAKQLISEGIDPGPFLGDVEEARAGIDSIHRQLYEKLESKMSEAGAPGELFNQRTYDLMINYSLEGHFKAKSYRLASEETKKLADAEYQMRAGGRLLRPGER
ncbi:hypothetical protein OVA24_04880 [Luteolibacter sp. SL250]|uniref:hypothetical protein n=1 Tax=Luteolibacter sp. SL250 TaxID=2995170 RepID=UPI0022707E1D|nr:hypothetical protein [Luteolibacter sp. SL250]WAC20714.1 hypothetical protein OVA24_04880 [Luteolibacter sp. SL250]